MTTRPFIRCLAFVLLLALVACGAQAPIGDPEKDEENPEDPNASTVPVWTVERGEVRNNCLLAMDLNAAGNLTVVRANGCTIVDTTTFGDGTLSIEEYDANGVELAAVSRDNEHDEWGFLSSDAAIAADGSVIVAGDTRKTPFDVDNGDFDLVVVKYDSSGDEVWSSQFGTPGHDHATSVALAPDGSIYVGGHTTGEFPGQTRSAIDATHTDLILIKVDSTGKHQWTRQTGTAASTRANDVTTDQAGNVYVTGYTMGQLPGNNYRGALDAFVAKYGSSGTHLWTRQFGTAGNDIGNAVATDSSGNVFATGYVSGALPGQTQSGDSDAFVVKFSGDGATKWTTQFGMPGGDSGFGFPTGNTGYGINVAENGDVLVAGNTTGSFPNHANQGGRDLFMTRLTSTGGIRSTFQYGNEGKIDAANHVVADDSGNYYIGGKITLVEESGSMIVDNVIIIKYRP